MNYVLLKEIISSLEIFEQEQIFNQDFSNDFEGYKKWLVTKGNILTDLHINWEGKDQGRSLDSVINTLVVHLNRYAKSYSKSVIYNTNFASQEDFIYLINLKVFGSMTKMELIKKNIHEKSPGMQIINRLIDQGWVAQSDGLEDRRSKKIEITNSGIEELDLHMDKIRNATKIVSGNLTHIEKLTLINLLQKLETFHLPIYTENIKSEDLLDHVMRENPFLK